MEAVGGTYGSGSTAGVGTGSGAGAGSPAAAGAGSDSPELDATKVSYRLLANSIG